ncbi:MAG: phosphoribosylglycinamide formyltransferase [Nitrospiraceae bacterium]|nr:phosphoribosylglycinamide formyltransferase [Nitrospiraceae bacterium]
MLKIGVLASGRGSNFQAVMDAIKDGRIKNAAIALLITDKPDAYAIERARANAIPFVYLAPRDYPTKDAYFEKIARELAEKGVGLVLLAGFMRIVRRPLLDAFPWKVMNIHPALLPSFPGLHGQRQAADYGVKISGCTVHFVDEGMDTGPIIIQAAVPVRHDDTEESLSGRILEHEHRIYPEAVRLFAEGRLEVQGKKVAIKGPRTNGAALVNPPLENFYLS